LSILGAALLNSRAPNTNAPAEIEPRKKFRRLKFSIAFMVFAPTD